MLQYSNLFRLLSTLQSFVKTLIDWWLEQRKPSTAASQHTSEKDDGELYMVGPQLGVLIANPDDATERTRIQNKVATWTYHGGCLNTYGWHLNRPRHFEIHGGPGRVKRFGDKEITGPIYFIDGADIESSFSTTEVMPSS